MSLKEELKRFNINAATLNEVLQDALEMGQLKSNFDIEKFTIAKEGKFLCHQFHFLMRQYLYAQSEMRRMLLEKEELERNIKELQLSRTKKWRDPATQLMKYKDLEIKRLQNMLELKEVEAANKVAMCAYFEKCRKKLKELGGEFTNEQYQAETPAYWKWFIEQRMKQQRLQAATGIHEGIWENIAQMEAPALLNPEFQLPMMDSLTNALAITTGGTNNDQRVRQNERVLSEGQVPKQ